MDACYSKAQVRSAAKVRLHTCIRVGGNDLFPFQPIFPALVRVSRTGTL
jgi:hypothetical protein